MVPFSNPFRNRFARDLLVLVSDEALNAFVYLNSMALLVQALLTLLETTFRPLGVKHMAAFLDVYPILISLMSE